MSDHPQSLPPLPWHGLTHRVVEPELLETFSDDHPAAVQSRRELQTVNFVMGNHRWIMRQIRRHAKPGWRVLELGAGCGTLGRRILKAGLCRESELKAMDLAQRPSHWPSQAEWLQGDMFQHTLPEAEVVIANLFLHHFPKESLQALGSRIPDSTRLILAAEPARSALHCWLGRLLCILTRFSFVTRYDMQVSIRAGFRRDDLASALQLGPDWQVTSQGRPLGAYRFQAIRVGKD